MPTLQITSPYVVDAGTVLEFTDEIGIRLTHPFGSDITPKLTGAGKVTVTQTTGANGNIVGIQIGAGALIDGPILISSTGQLRLLSDVAGHGALGILGSYSGETPDVENQGILEVRARGDVEGVVDTISPDWDVTNRATIVVASKEGYATGVTGRGFGGSYVNSGSFIVTGHKSAVAVGAFGSNTSFYNSGTILARTDTPDVKSVAVAWEAAFGADATFVNDGVIEGDYALKSDSFANNGGKEVYVNNGALIGAVELGSYNAILVNNGAIRGAVSLGLGDDTYDGTHGTLTDAVDGGGGADRLFGGPAADQLLGGDGDDIIGGGGGADTLDGGAGRNALTLEGAAAGAHIDLAMGSLILFGEAKIANFQEVMGGAFADTIFGSAGDERLSGGKGDDNIGGRAGADTITGGDGTNYLRGDEGDDNIVGGAGFDDINGNMGNDTCVSGGGDDWVVGGKDNDSLVGSAGQNLVYGNIGNDTCEGGDGNDIVRGGQDNDVIFGGAGDDYVSGDKGDDTVTGGLGADLFHTFGDAGIDRVLDFSLAQGDRVQLDPGTQYTVAQSGADTVISMTGGGQMILVGVRMSTLTAGWIFGA